MSEAKPFASLSSGLLARKGAARPAMRPQGFTQQSAALEDLGWNDMGHEAVTPQPLDTDQVVEHPRAVHRSGLSPVTSPVHSQQAELADRFAESDEEYDEEYDETAEPYEPEAGASGFAGFEAAEEDDEAGDVPFQVQFKGGKRPLDLGPGPDAESEPVAEADDSVLELAEVAMVEPQPAAPISRAVSRVRAETGAKGKAAFTLRLDPERHLKLRLACAVRGRSAQQLVTDALDSLLGEMPELDHMADQARRG